jgi:hypothetical protein
MKKKMGRGRIDHCPFFMLVRESENLEWNRGAWYRAFSDILLKKFSRSREGTAKYF